MTLFLDTSGLLACFWRHGQATATLLRAWREEKVIVISKHADLEFLYEVSQAQASGTDPAACVAVASEYQTVSQYFVRFQTDALYLRAALLGIQHKLKPGQALHLAVALEFQEQRLQQQPTADCPVVFGTLDPKLAAAAEQEGFRVLP